ncbi:MAG TPA: glycosyltransferase family 87 protein [Acidimicrobiales bacterium]|nr:glycosyltransferase family 87 protein [Acidimicrobiales bacterium]
MPGTIEGDGRGAPARSRLSASGSTHPPTALSALKGRWQRFRTTATASVVATVATVVAWGAAALTWTLQCLHDSRGGPNLGWDLVTCWRAERVFARGGQPYSLAATGHRLFLYPPSALLVLRPLAELSLHDVQLLGLAATAALMWAAVMISAAVLGRRWWGLAAALVLLALVFAEPLLAELSLENVTIICTFGLVAFYVLATRGHWASAGLVIGLTLAVKPLLLVVLLVFVLARRWRALIVTLAVPAVLNAVAFAVVKDPSEVFSKLPSLLNRSGSGVFLNSAWVDVLRTLGVPDAITILVRLATVALVLVVAWWSWQQLDDTPVRIITTSSVLLIGSYLAGTLSENHFMLTLVPLAMTAVVAGAPMRWLSAWIGVLLLMGLTPPGSLLGLNAPANLSAGRAFGMALVLLTVGAALGYRRLASRKARSAPLPDGEAPAEAPEGAGLQPPRKDALEGVLAP